MSDGMGREPAYLSSHATNRYFIPNWGNMLKDKDFDIMFFGVFEEHSGFNRGFMETVNIEKTFKI